MGSFTFKWEHPDASDVYVTGTFDDWAKSEKLDKKGEVFEKTVTLPNASEKIYYKFFVDGRWCTDPTAPQENDLQGNLNNVLTPERITKHTPETAGIMSSVAPTSTTYELAKDVPLEKSGSSDLPGTFPETPATEPASFSVSPIPATAGAGNPISLAAGEKVPDPSALTSNNISSTVHDDVSLAQTTDDSQQTFSVAPIPATAGAGNPISLEAGEKLPTHSAITGNTINSTVQTDKESYENSDAGPPVLAPVDTPQVGHDEKGTGVLDLPPVSSNMIPESSLPMGATGVGTFDASPMIQSAGPQSTTAQLAANVPLESKESAVPEIVKDSQMEAGFDPEASAFPEEVQEKSAVEKELLSEVRKAPVTSDDTTAAKSAGATVAEVAGLGEATNSVTASATDAKDEAMSATGLGQPSTTADAAPAVVKESIAESGQSPEAAAFAEPIAEKRAVEKELLSEVKLETSTGEPAPKVADTSALSPPVISPVISSRDISPTTVPGSHTETAPTLTSGVTSTTTEKTSEASATPAKETQVTTAIPSGSKVESPASPASGSSAAADAKKKKRTSFFGKLRAKFSDKDKDKS